MNALLFIVALIIFIPAYFANMALYVVVNVRKFGYKRAKTIIRIYLRRQAYELDVYANEAFPLLWNSLFMGIHGYSFGNKGESISYALGRNQILKTLTIFGKIIVNIDNLFEKEHCLKAVEILDKKRK